jgi:DNA-directed RNA polymerase specialized sigma24 family protein
MLSEQARAIRDALGRLTPERAELATRHYADDEHLQTISKDLGLSPTWGSHLLPVVRETLLHDLKAHAPLTLPL